MAVNERLQWGLLDIYYGQLAPSQANRTEYYPGKASSQPGDILGKDYRVPQANAALEQAGPVEMERVRVVKLGRNIISDQTIDGRTAGYDWPKVGGGPQDGVSLVETFDWFVLLTPSSGVSGNIETFDGSWTLSSTSDTAGAVETFDGWV